MIKEGIYIIKFESKEEMTSFLNKSLSNVSLRCKFSTKNSVSVGIDKNGFYKLISEGYLPEYIGSINQKPLRKN